MRAVITNRKAIDDPIERDLSFSPLDVSQGAEQTKSNKDGFSKFNGTYASNCPPFSTETNTETTSQGNKFQKTNGRIKTRI